ncbi:MAG: aminotransferase, partial [Gammaproteobacteria bacterium]|nr:aminotransferase [Gammaproteobacteria bacterium]
MLSCQKHLFSLPEGLHYLNCASRAPLLQAAEAAGIHGLRRQIAPVAVAPEVYFAEPEALRASIAALVNASPDQIAITPSVSYGVAIAVHNTRLASDQNVVVVEEEFPSDVYGWIERCRGAGAELRTVARPESGTSWN